MSIKDYRVLTHKIGLLGITNLLLKLSGLILLPVLTKNLTIEEYGIWVQFIVTVGLIPTLLTLGLSTSMIRFLAAAKQNERIKETFYSIFFFVFGVCVIGTSFLFLYAKPIAGLLFDNRTIIVTFLAITILIQCLNNFLLNYFRTFQQIKMYSFFLFAQDYFNVVLVASLIFLGYGVFGAVIGFLIIRIILFLFMFVYIVLQIGIKIPKFINIKEYLSFGLPTMPGILSSWIVRSSDRYVIGIFLGTAFVGYYSPGYVLGDVILIFLAPFSILLPAVTSKYYDENKINEVKVVLKFSLKYFFALAIPFVFIISLLSKPILTILATQNIAEHGFLVTPFVATSNLLFGVRSITTQILILKKRTKIAGLIWFMAAIVNLGLNFIFIPYYGILGAAITTLIAYSLGLFLTLYYSFKLFSFDISLAFILKSIFASSVMSAPILIRHPEGVSSIFLLLAVAILIYLFVMFVLRSFSKEELIFFKKLLRF